jgi:tetratricopeptide (TPR) repeat protein
MMVISSRCAAGADSLLTALLEVVNDTERVNRLYQRGFFLKNNDPALAAEYSLHCMEAARQSGSMRHLAKAHSLRGVLLYRRGLLVQALKEHELALAMRIKCNDLAGQAISLTNAGNIYTDQRRYQMGEESYLKAIAIHTRNNDRYRLSLCLVNLGTLKQTQGQPRAAEEYYRMALGEAEEGNDYETRSLCLNNLAVLKADEGKYEDAMALHQDALKLRLLMEDELGQTDSYLNLCDLNLRTGDLGAASALLQKAVQMSEDLDYFEGKKETLKLKAAFFKLSGDFRNAFVNLERFYKVNDSLANTAAEPDEAAQDDFLQQPSRQLKNTGLLVLVLMMMAGIPVLIFRYKR